MLDYDNIRYLYFLLQLSLLFLPCSPALKKKNCIKLFFDMGGNLFLDQSSEVSVLAHNQGYV